MHDESMDCGNLWISRFEFATLLRAFRHSCNPSQILLALVLVLALLAIGTTLDRIWPKSGQVVVSLDDGVVADSEVSHFIENGWSAAAANHFAQESDRVSGDSGAPRRGAFAVMVHTLRDLANRGTDAVFSFRLLSDASGNRGLLSVGKMTIGTFVWFASQRAGYMITFLIPALLVFGWVGTAIYRHAAMLTSREEAIGPIEAMKFAKRHWLDTSLALIAPAVVMGLMYVGLVVCGWIAGIPFIGWLASLFWFVLLLGGLILAIFIVLSFVTAPLMGADVGVNASDFFESFASSISYAATRHWRTPIYYVIVVVFGAICLKIIKAIGGLMFALTHAAVGTGMNRFHVTNGGESATGKLDAIWSAPAADTSFYGVPGMAAATDWPAQSFMSTMVWFWTMVFVLLIAAWAFSYAISASTAIYLLLRRLCEGIDLEEIDADDGSDDLFDDVAATSAPQEPAGGTA